MENESVERTAQAVADRATVKAAFGEPQQIGERTIIPVAQVTYGYGFGYGTGPRAEGTPPEGQAPGRGGGGGAGARVKPLGALVVTPSEVKFQPTVDTASIAIGGMLLAAWNIFWITLTVRQGLRSRRT